jgi:cytoskeletal protein RodZ
LLIDSTPGVVVNKDVSHEGGKSLETLGAHLSRKREERGLGVDELARQTRIQLHILKGLEADAWDGLPHHTFLKGFIRAYCRAVGTSDARALELFEERLGLNPPAAVPAREGAERPAPRELPRPVRVFRTPTLGGPARFSPAVAVVAVLLVLALVFFAVKITRSSTPDVQPDVTRMPAPTSPQAAFNQNAGG